MKGVILLLTFFTGFVSFSQTTFSGDREKFVKELQKLMSASTSENLNPFIKEELTPMLLESSDFPDDYFNRMISTSNQIIEKKLKPYPDAFNYIYSVYELAKQKQPKESYEAWHESVDKMLSARNPKKFKTFSAMSKGFFERRVINLDKNYEWCYLGGEYTFKYGKYPTLDLTGGKLVCRTFNTSSKTYKKIPYSDSIVITETSGEYNPILEKWVGKNGKCTWEKAKLPANETFAELGNYNISMKSASFNADSVLLTTPFFSRKLSGKFSERAQKGSYNPKLEIQFPQFLSYENRLEIKDLVPDVDYEGGFSLRGADFIGVGSPKDPIALTFYRNDKPFIRTKSQLLSLSPDKISTNNCMVAIKVGENDSIWHPGLNLAYQKESDLVEIKRGNSGISQAPFSNSYHQLDMYVEQIIWDRSSTVLDFAYSFSSSQEQRVARFESKNFYDARLYEMLQGKEGIHPLVGLSKYAYKYDETTFNEGTAATALGRTITQAKPTLLKLSNLGFIAYDTERGIVSINDKLDNFIKARSGKQDYDNIMFVSDLRPKRMNGVSNQEMAADEKLRKQKERIDQLNRERQLLKSYGKIDLANLELSLDAVNDIPLSASQGVTLFPDGDKVTLRKNRNFIFNGWVNAGKWEVKINEGNFNYDEYRINILESEIALFRANPQLAKDGKKPIALQSEISGIIGYIQIDDPNNRAGNKEDKEYQIYPELVSREKTKVFYEKPNIYRNAYEKSRFYFELDPFTIDSLDNFNERALRLGGELTSAGIFPKFKDSLKLMADYSLGFKKNAPKSGYDFYAQGAKYDSVIVLSNNGLQGSGQIDFVNSSSISRAFTFLPDSTVGIANFVNRPQETGVQFPDVNSPDAYITYVPKTKILKARSTNTPLSFFNGEAKLKGIAIVKPNGMTGSGFMDFTTASLGSKNFKYKRWDIDADTSVFNLRNIYKEEGDLTEDPLAFKTDNVNSAISFKDRKGVFKSNAGESTVEFPVNKYVCKMDQFSWMMDQASIEMESASNSDLNLDSDLDLVGPNFFSIHPKQDSLQFRAPKAVFNLKEKTIFCSETEFIDVADARIYPDSAKVTIRKNARMEPLLNSTIVANYITKFHTIINASTNITARRAYKSEGDYKYYDVDSTLYLIHLDEVRLDTSYQTVAVGKIESEDDFRLSDQFDYYGDVQVLAAQKEVNFNGATKIDHNCDKFNKNWMAFKAPIDPVNIQIPVSENMKDLDNNAISAGIVWRNSNNTDSVEMYPTFLSMLDNQDDPIVISASGFLQFDPSSKEYQIASKAKLLNRAEKGNYISLHAPTCGLNGDGVINLGMDYGDMTVENVGVVNYATETEKTTFNLTMKISTPMDKGVFENVAERIILTPDLKPADFNSNTLEQAIATWVGVDDANEIKSDFTLKGEVKKVPKPMQKTFVFSGVRLESYNKNGDPQKGIKTSTEDAILVSMYGKPVMKYVPLKMFAEQKLGGDQFSFMMDVPGSNLYFFQYNQGKKDGVMSILTSDVEMKTAITEIKDEKRKIKKFEYNMTQQAVMKSKFLRVFGG